MDTISCYFEGQGKENEDKRCAYIAGQDEFFRFKSAEPLGDKGNKNENVEYELRCYTDGYGHILFFKKWQNVCSANIYLQHFVLHRQVIVIFFYTYTFQITQVSHETGVIFSFYGNLIICSSFVCEILPLCVWQKEWKGKSGFSNPGPEGGD